MGQGPSRGCGGSPLPESPRGILQPAAPGPSAGPEAGPGDMLCDIMRGFWSRDRQALEAR